METNSAWSDASAHPYSSSSSSSSASFLRGRQLFLHKSKARKTFHVFSLSTHFNRWKKTERERERGWTLGGRRGYKTFYRRLLASLLAHLMVLFPSRTGAEPRERGKRNREKMEYRVATFWQRLFLSLGIPMENQWPESREQSETNGTVF